MKTTEQILKEIDVIVETKIQIDWNKMADRMQKGLNRIKAQTKKDLEEIEERMVRMTDKVMANVLHDISNPRKRSRY
jgi:Fe2+ transport system protein B